jgi:hypothetical protein
MSYLTGLLILLSRTRWEITTRHASSVKDFRKAIRSDGDENPCKAGLRSVCWKVSTIGLKIASIDYLLLDLFALPRHRGHGMVSGFGGLKKCIYVAQGALSEVYREP